MFTLTGRASGTRRQWYACEWHRLLIRELINEHWLKNDPDGLMTLSERPALEVVK